MVVKSRVRCVTGVEKFRVVEDGRLTDLWEVYETTFCDDGSVIRKPLGVEHDV